MALWSQARYGWFISSKVSDKQIAIELAKELEQLGWDSTSEGKSYWCSVKLKKDI